MGRTRFFEKRKSVPSGLPKDDRIIIHEFLDSKKKRKITKKSLQNTNYSDIKKEDYAIATVDFINEIEALRRELVDSRAREGFLRKKLVEHGISAILTPEEIEEYRLVLNSTLIQEVDRVMDNNMKNINEYILSKVSKALAESKIEFENDPEYEIIRLQNYNKIIDVEIDKITRSQIALEKKQKAICSYMKTHKDNFNTLTELYKKYKPEKNLENNKNSTSINNETQNKTSNLTGIVIPKFGD